MVYLNTSKGVESAFLKSKSKVQYLSGAKIDKFKQDLRAMALRSTYEQF